ncbi:MAG TPA: amidohydrolase family protein [Chloroflexota bacterium]|nr:amidohydrolase family protein [Chloroflexota bacterium]
MIIDAHMHLGECRIFDNDVTEQALMDALDRNQVDAAIVQPFPGAPDPRAVHDRIANLAAKHPGRIFGLASLSPHCDQDVYYKEVERCVRDLGFVAVKLHTVGHAVNPLHRDGELVFATAAALGVPVMVHTGPGIPFALPSLTLRGAKKYPDTPVVLAHAGALIYTQEAMVTAEMADNIYLETSWIGPPMIGMVIRRLGPERVMFGSDLLPNIPTELVKYRTIGLSDDVLDTTMRGTAAKVFRLPLPGQGS